MVDRSGGALIREVGLSADGPIVWGRPLPSRKPGVYVVEWPAAAAQAPIDHNLLRAWLERAPDLLVDSARPTAHEVAARLARFWLPEQTVVYIGMTTRSLGGRVAAYVGTPLGERRPHHGGHWLKTLRGYDHCRIWWAETDATEEYEDALLTAFAGWVGRADALPFANLSSLSSGRRAHGITGAARVETDEAALASAGASGSPGAASGRRGAPIAAPTARRRSAAQGVRPDRPTATRAPRAPKRHVPRIEAAHLTADGLAQLQAELVTLRDERRPEVISRVRSARELGDLKENSEYHAAREEQSFLEGRIQQVQALLDRAVVSGGTEGGVVAVGSEVEVAAGDERHVYRIVGSSESDPSSGRISYESPIGRALMGRRIGERITVTTPAGPRELEVRAVR